MFKRILVPVDFSSCSINALRYAVPLAKKMQVEEVLIMHAFVAPVAHGDLGVTSISDTLVKEQTKEIEESFEMIKKAVPELSEISYSVLTKQAMLIDALISISLTSHIDLILMGTDGATGIDELIFGTNAYTAVKETKCPVLIIPQKVGYTDIKQITLASDFKELDKKTLDPIKTICKVYDSSVNIVHVNAYSETPTDKADEAKELEKYFQDVKHKYHYIKNADVEKGLEEYIKNNTSDLLTIVPRKHPLFDRVFGSGESKSIIFHTHTPLLSLPEKH